MISDISLGRFVNTGSIIHKIDPRIKLIFNFILALLTFFSNSYISFALLYAVMFFIIIFTKIPLNLYFKSLRSILFFILITFFINTFFLDGTVIFKFGFLKITYEGLKISIIASLKLILLILMSSLLLFVTSIKDLTRGIEKLMAPLKLFRINVRDFATIITLSLRFIPILMEETDKIITAQRARGAKINSGSLYKRAKGLSNILVPLLVASFKRADELAISMETRCYSYECKKTKMNVLKIKTIDIMSIFVIILISLIVLWLNFNF